MAEESGEFDYVSNTPYGRTAGNLVMAFRREAKSSARYALYASYARDSGYGSVAALFSACAYSERIHAVRHAKTALFMGLAVDADLRPIRHEQVPDMLGKMLAFSTLADLIYPDLIEEALQDRYELAALSFKLAMQSEKTHIMLCRQAIDSSDYWKSENRQFYVCSLCGNTRSYHDAFCDCCGGAFDHFTVFDATAEAK